MPERAPLRDSLPPRLAKPAFSNFRWFIVGLLFLATTIDYIDRQILALLKSTMDSELGWTNEQYGLVDAAFQTTYALSYVGFGCFIDRYGIKIGYFVSISMWSIAAMCHGLAGGVYIVAFLVNQLLAPRFEQVDLDGASRNYQPPATILTISSRSPALS